MIALLTGAVMFALGLFFGWLLHRERVERALYEDAVRARDRANTTLAETAARLELANKDMIRLRGQLTEAQHRVEERDAAIAELEAELESERERARFMTVGESAEREVDRVGTSEFADLWEAPAPRQPRRSAGGRVTTGPPDARLFDDLDLDLDGDVDITEEVAVPPASDEPDAEDTDAADGGLAEDVAAEDVAVEPVAAGWPDATVAATVDDACDEPDAAAGVDLAPPPLDASQDDAAEADVLDDAAEADAAEDVAAEDVALEPVAAEADVLDDAAEADAAEDVALEPVAAEAHVLDDAPPGAAGEGVGTAIVADAPVSDDDGWTGAVAPGGTAPPPSDDLQQISGVGPALERLLRDEGITTFRQLASFDDASIDELRLRSPRLANRMRRDSWVSQARRLHIDAHGDEP